MFLDRHRVVRSTFDSGIIGHDHAFASRYPADTGDDSRRGALVVIQAVGSQRRDLQHRTTAIEQSVDAVAGQKFSARDVPLAGALWTTKRSSSELVTKLFDKPVVRLAVGAGRCHRRTHLWLMATN